MNTNGCGRPLADPRGRRLWPVAVHIPIRFHDLRHTFATELLRRGVDSYRVQRLMRHSDVRVTLGTHAHLLVEDLRAAADAPSTSSDARRGKFSPNRAPRAASRGYNVDRRSAHFRGRSAVWIGAGNRIRTGDPQLGNARREAGSLWQRMADVRKSSGWRARSERPFAHLG